MPNGHFSLSLSRKGNILWSQDLNIPTKMCLSSIKLLFDKWCHQYGYQFAEDYTSRYRNFRFKTFQIINHNLGDKGKYYTLHHNKFSHLSRDEWSNYLGYNIKYSKGVKNSGLKFSDDISIVPFKVDWRDKNVVTHVKNQGQCGSCWAFSTIGALEGAYAIKYDKLREFSEEQLVSCDTEDGGCGGGLMDNAFDWIGKNGGVCNESSFPYTSGGPCSTNCTIDPDTNVTNHVDVNQSQKSLEKAVSKQPVSIAIEADQLAFQSYQGGVITGDCGQQLDHGVLLVGYGYDRDLDLDYWLIKNSWGTDWGEEGYVRIQRGKDVEGGQCGILLSASYPVL